MCWSCLFHIYHITPSQFSLTGSRDYLPTFRGDSKPVEAFVTVIRGEIVPNIKKDAYNALINLSSDPIVAEALVRPWPVLESAAATMSPGDWLYS